MRFSYYRRKLKVLGITTESEFKKALKLRSNRISRTASAEPPPKKAAEKHPTTRHPPSGDIT